MKRKFLKTTIVATVAMVGAYTLLLSWIRKVVDQEVQKELESKGIFEDDWDDWDDWNDGDEDEADEDDWVE